MTERVTKTETANALANLTRAAQAVGLDPTGWAVIEGSQTYGHAWRLYRVDPATGGHHEVPIMSTGGYLGWSRREATDALWMLGAALWGVSRERDRVTS